MVIISLRNICQWDVPTRTYKTFLMMKSLYRFLTLVIGKFAYDEDFAPTSSEFLSSFATNNLDRNTDLQLKIINSCLEIASNNRKI